MLINLLTGADQLALEGTRRVGMLKMEELRELAKGKKLDHFGTTSPAEIDEKVSSSHDPP